MNKLAFEYITAIATGDSEKIKKLTSDLLDKYVAKISDATAADIFELPFAVAALKICAESHYNVLEPSGKDLCDEIVMRCSCVSIVRKKSKEGENNE